MAALDDLLDELARLRDTAQSLAADIDRLRDQAKRIATNDRPTPALRANDTRPERPTARRRAFSEPPTQASTDGSDAGEGAPAGEGVPAGEGDKDER